MKVAMFFRFNLLRQKAPAFSMCCSLEVETSRQSDEDVSSTTRIVHNCCPEGDVEKVYSKKTTTNKVKLKKAVYSKLKGMMKGKKEKGEN